MMEFLIIVDIFSVFLPSKVDMPLNKETKPNQYFYSNCKFIVKTISKTNSTNQLNFFY